jgi:hypothetical protein
MRKSRGALLIVGALVLFLVIAWLASDKDGRNRAAVEPLGTPIEIKLQFEGTRVTVAATDLRPITAQEQAEGGFRRWESVYNVDLEEQQIWVVEYTVVRGGEGEIDGYQLGRSNWSVVNDRDDRIHSAFWSAELPCEPTTEWREPSVTSCAFFIVPEGDRLTEVQFSGVDTSNHGRRQLPVIERYVVWTLG